MIAETEHYILRCHKAHFLYDPSFEFDADIKNGLTIEKKYPTENVEICDIIFNAQKGVCETIFTDNSLVDNIMDWSDYQELAQLIDEAHFKVELANAVQRFNEMLD